MKLPQASLREFFWLVLVVALALGWWADQSRITKRVSELDDQKESYSELMNDVVIAQQRCEKILDEWAELKQRDAGLMNPPLPPKRRPTDDDEI
jgi:hypothetical protein